MTHVKKLKSNVLGFIWINFWEVKSSLILFKEFNIKIRNVTSYKNSISSHVGRNFYQHSPSEMMPLA